VEQVEQWQRGADFLPLVDHDQRSFSDEDSLMISVKVRFHGRYVLAEETDSAGQPTGKWRFLAPHYRRTGFAPHRTMMCVRRDRVSNVSGETTLAPTFKVMGEGAKKEDVVEYFVWDLDGCIVTFDVTGGMKLSYVDNTIIPSLEELEYTLGRTAVLDKTCLEPCEPNPIGAAIELSGGAAFASAVVPNKCDFITQTNAQDGDIFNDEPILLNGTLADQVEVRLLGPKQRLTVSKGGVKWYITILGGNDDSIASVSNLCGSIPQNERYDFEYGQYYEVLTVKCSNRPVPIVTHMGDTADCDLMTRIRYKQ
jgi:hypothetical protein